MKLLILKKNVKRPRGLGEGGIAAARGQGRGNLLYCLVATALY